MEDEAGYGFGYHENNRVGYPSLSVVLELMSPGSASDEKSAINQEVARQCRARPEYQASMLLPNGDVGPARVVHPQIRAVTGAGYDLGMQCAGEEWASNLTMGLHVVF